MGRLRDAVSRRLPIGLARWLHWEFWPAWAAWGPIVPVYVWLGLRHRSWTLPLIANGQGPLAMLAGESKHEIMRMIPAWARVGSVRVGPGAAGVEEARAAITAHGWAYPVIVKPDLGYRGSGVRKVREDAGLVAVVGGGDGPMLVQPFHPGPGEVGIFYVKRPGAEAGRILSVTLKVFSSVVGDGVRTVGRLAEADARRRIQRQTFRARLGSAWDRVPARGEVVPLGVAGNHCQGTLFVDGGHLVTPALSAAVERIAREVPGLFYGRFDARYADEAALMRGEGFAVIELNGIASESTNVYDPARSSWWAWRTMAACLAEAFAIGAERRAMGVKPPTLREAWRAVREARRVPNGTGLAD
jgi:hypothetical protein